MTKHLFTSYQLGKINLPHRIVMAPLTRSRASQPGNVPNDLNARYYSQRSQAALIITEATQISQQGQGYAWTPGIHTPEQVSGWKKVTEAVHKNNGHIFIQLWHVGRISHSSFQPGGGLPVAPSAIAAPGKTFIEGVSGKGEWADVSVPQALNEEGIQAIIQDYRQAAINAINAGMDGIEIHAGNGYLLDQFINSSSNQREDQYGGSIENRARLLLEVTETIIDAIGAERVGIRITPMGRFMGMADETPFETFGYIASKLNQLNPTYLHLVEPAMVGTEKDEGFNPDWDKIILDLRQKFKGTLILAGGYDQHSAEQALQDGRADLIAFGRPFIANPDLPKRFKNGGVLNSADPSLFFGGGARGYIDYPRLDGRL